MHFRRNRLPPAEKIGTMRAYGRSVNRRKHQLVLTCAAPNPQEKKEEEAKNRHYIIIAWCRKEMEAIKFRQIGCIVQEMAFYLRGHAEHCTSKRHHLNVLLLLFEKQNTQCPLSNRSLYFCCYVHRPFLFNGRRFMDTLRSDRNSALTLTCSICTIFPLHRNGTDQGAEAAEVGPRGMTQRAPE